MLALLETLVLILLPALALDAVPPVPRVVGTTGGAREAVCLAADRDDLWVGTRGGVLLHRSGSSRRLGASDGLPGNRVTDCRLHQGRLWVATEAGLAVLAPGGARFDTILAGRFLRLAASGERLLVARDDGRIFHLIPTATGAALRKVDILEAPPLSLSGVPGGSYAAGMADGRLRLGDGTTLELGAPVIGLVADGDLLRALTPGRAWSIRDGAATRDPGRDEAAAVLADGTPISWDGAALVHGAARWGDLVAVATDEGVQTQPAAGGAWTTLPDDGLPCGPRLAALATYRGELWVGGFDSGVCRLHRGRWIQYRGRGHLPSDMINHMTATRRRLYIATLAGVAVVDRDGTFHQATHEECMGDIQGPCPWHASVTGVAVDPLTGRTWLADTGAVHRIGHRKWTHYYRRSGISSNRITRIAARDGKVAAGTVDQGILLKDGGGPFTGLDDRGGLTDNWVMDLAWDRAGALWVATCTRGLGRWDGSRWTSWTTREGLSDDYTLSVDEIDGRIWVGTLRGLTVLSPGGAIRLTTRDGLAGDEVHDVLGHGGKVYLATDGGLTTLEMPAPR
jgi:ligand-binding sensor domain-containing protein